MTDGKLSRMLPRRDYRTLDAFVVIAGMLIMAGVFVALAVLNIPQANLPILSGLAGTLFGGTVGLYAGARWNAKGKGDDDGVDPSVK